MKKGYYKRHLYIFGYLLFIIIISIINSCSTMDLLEVRLNLFLVTNPLIFGILDGIVLHFIMKKLAKEPYRLQQRVIHYFKTINNFIIGIIMLLSSAFNIFSVGANLIIHMMLVYLLRPMSQDPEANDGVREYFDKYPDRSHHKFYKDADEIKKDYDPLKKEVANEIPVLTIKTKDQKQEKRKKILMVVIPIIIIVLVGFALIFTFVDMLKQWNRAFYNEFEIVINDKEMNAVYNSEYKKVVIPVLYTQHEEWSFQTNKEKLTIDNYLSRVDKYIIDIKEFECINNDKGNNVRCSCGMEALSETRKEINNSNNKLIIIKNNKELYNGKFINDITKYLKENGTYDIRILNKNKDDYMTTTIRFKLSINEIAIED